MGGRRCCLHLLKRGRHPVARARAARLEDPAFRQSLAERGIAGPYLAYAFGIHSYAEARDLARSVGVGVPSARDADVAPRQIAA